MPDLSKLSDADLQALKSGDLAKLSDEGLSSLKDPSVSPEGGAPASDPYLNTPSSFRSLGRGVAQAGMNIIEGPAKIAEDLGVPVPRPQWAVDLKRSVDKDPYARGAEMAAGFGTGFIPVAKAAQATQIPRLVSQYAPTISKLAGQVMGPVSRAWEAIGPAGRGAVIAPLTSPATGEHPWRERAEQAAGGAVLGGATGRAVRGVEATRAAQASYAQEKASYDALVQARQAAYQQRLAAHGAAVQAYPGQKAAWDVANQARQGFRPFDPMAANEQTYRWVMDPVGGMGPFKPGPQGLIEMREGIGARLNETADQMSYYPDESALADLWNAPHGTDLIQRHPGWPAEYHRIVTGPLRAVKLDDGTIELGRGMSGADYGKYISSIRQAADRYATSARGTMGTDPDKLQMAQELRHAIEAIEEGADAPPGIKEARARARTAYRRWATVDNAAKVGQGDIATPGSLLTEMDRRMRRRDFVSDPMRQQFEDWRVQSKAKRPSSPGPEPTRPGPAPTPPSKPRGEPKLPKEPKQVSRLKPVLQGIGHLGGLAAGAKVGHPYIGSTLGGSAGAGLANLISGQTGRLGRVVGQFPRSPYGAAILGGQVAPMVDPAAQSIQDLLDQWNAQRAQ